MKSIALGVVLAASIVWGQAGRTVYRIETIAGTSSTGDGGAAILAELGSIRGVAADRLGNLYISDTDHHRVRKVDPSGILTTVAGTGVAGFSGDGGAAISAQLNLPYGLAVDTAGVIYIADLGNNRVRRIGTDGKITTLAGSAGSGSTGDGGMAVDAQLMTPRNVAVDAAGTVYISEFGAHRVRKVTTDGKIATAAGIGVAGFRGDGGLAVSAQLHSPAGLAVDRSGDLYIADSENQRIRKVLPGGMIATVLGGTTTTTLYTPTGVAVDLNNNLYVVDGGSVVHEYTSGGSWVSAAGSGAIGFGGDGGKATAASLSMPYDAAVNLSGTLYVADGLRVRAVDGAGKISTVAGDGYLHAIGDGGSATAALLNQPGSVWLDVAGNLWIAETGSGRVRKVDAAGNISTIAGTGAQQAGGEAVTAAGSPLDGPTDVKVDAYGNVWIVETLANRIREIGTDGKIRTVMGTSTAGLGPEGLAAKDTQLRGPRGICMDRSGTIFVADTLNHRVLRWPAGGVVITAAGNGSAGMAGDGGSARLAQLNAPRACTTDSAGNLYIADTGNHAIRKVDTKGVITTIAGTGTAGSAGDDGPAIAAQLQFPGGLAVDDNGNLYVGDTGNHRIRQVSPDRTIRTIAGTGSAGFSGDGSSATDALLDGPGGVLLDGSGELYVADTNNNRVRRIVPNGVILPPPPVVVPPLGVGNAADGSVSSVAPGEVVSIFGSGIGPQLGAGAVTDTAGTVANQLAGTEVRFDGVPAPLFYVQASQINVQVPYTVNGAAQTHIEVFYQGKSAGTADVPVVQAAPAIFLPVVNQDGTFNSATNPASHGTYLTFWATGEGVTNGANVAGLPATAPYAKPKLPVTVTVAGNSAEVAYAGSAPGLVGLMQVNVRVPGGFVPSGQVAMRLVVGTTAAPDVQIWVK